MSKSNFLPNDYNVPAGASKYMKFKQGSNKFRILGSPVLGYEGWKDKKPVRIRMGESFGPDQIDKLEEAKHFWAMPVWNYDDEKIQILEITQKTLQRTLRALSKDPEWGNPLDYDVVVVREGEGMDTEYQLIPSPPKPVLESITEAYNALFINVEALFDGGDPFVPEITEKDMDAIDGIGENN